MKITKCTITAFVAAGFYARRKIYNKEMTMQNKFLQRKPNRLKNYDYSQNGCYFITICTKDKKCVLSHIKNSTDPFNTFAKEIIKTKNGNEFEKALAFTVKKYNVTLDNYIIMPNHVHILLTFENDSSAYFGGRGNPPLQKMIGEIKSYTTKIYRKNENDNSLILWQRSFYDHIIRNETDFQNAWNYIEYNALKKYSKK